MRHACCSLRGALSSRWPKRAAVALLLAAPAFAATWADEVSPLLTPAEKKIWLALPPNDRAAFERDFWSAKTIGREEYNRRLQYSDDHWGSDKRGSGANTDPGRVFLGLGAPVRITRLPSSRSFVPLEIWYYDTVPGLLNTELRLIFFQKGSLGLPRLYSPTVDTIRALLVPHAGTVHMFGPNNSLTEANIRGTLKTGPAEDEVIPAAVAVATGIKYSGNDEILGQILSPERMLNATAMRPKVTTRLIAAQPPLDLLLTASPFNGSQADLHLEVNAQREIQLEVQDDSSTLYRNRLKLGFPTAKRVGYSHRLDLLPGRYRAIFTVDGTGFIYPLEIPNPIAMSGILRADIGSASATRAPFTFDSKRLTPTATGRSVVLIQTHPQKVTWMLRKGSNVAWRATSDPSPLATAELPANLPPGPYRLEAVTAGDSRAIDIQLGSSVQKQDAVEISFNANLAPAQRLVFLGHQWLLRGNLAQARNNLNAALRQAPSPEARIELARADLLAGQTDAARESIRAVLSDQPSNFEALAVYASIEARLQDYPIAAELYRRALAVQESPELRAALARVEHPLQ
jgi:GWxTD domain-containing protein